MNHYNTFFWRFLSDKMKRFDVVDDEKISNPWTFLNWIVYFKFNINIETFKNSDQVWKQNYKLWAPGPSLGSGGKHKKRKGKQSLRILYYFCVNTLVLLLHSPPRYKTVEFCEEIDLHADYRVCLLEMTFEDSPIARVELVNSTLDRQAQCFSINNIYPS